MILAHRLAPDRIIAGVHVAGEGPPIVLLHGAGATHHTFDPLLPYLARPELVIPSLPGREGSTGPPLASISELARLVAALIRGLGHRRAVVSGHSFGGAIALELAITEPELVCGLVLIATGARLRVHPTILATTTSDPAASDWRACDAFDRLADLGRVAAATRVVHGTADPFTPTKYQDHLVAHIPGAERDTLDGAGHDLPRERPAEVAAALLTSWSRFAA